MNRSYKAGEASVNGDSPLSIPEKAAAPPGPPSANTLPSSEFAEAAPSVVEPAADTVLEPAAETVVPSVRVAVVPSLI